MAKTEAELKGDFSSGHKWERLSAWTIVFGLVAEIVVLLAFTDEKHALETALMIGATVIIALGVWGEIHFSRKAEAAGDELHRISDEKVAEATARASEANQKAKEAELALEKFKAPRSLSPQQQSRIVARVTPWAGQLVSFSVTGEHEPLALMQAIREVLVAAGWVRIDSQIGDLMIDGAGLAVTNGVEIQIHPDAAQGTKSAGGANALASALLEEGGIAAWARLNPQLKNAEAINVMVGKKP